MQLVVFHDPLLHAAFPLDGANAAPAARLVEATGAASPVSPSVLHGWLADGCPAARSHVRSQFPPPAGIPFQQLTPQDLTLAQLHSLHLGGRPGLRIPTLQHYLE